MECFWLLAAPYMANNLTIDQIENLKNICLDFPDDFEDCMLNFTRYELVDVNYLQAVHFLLRSLKAWCK